MNIEIRMVVGQPDERGIVITKEAIENYIKENGDNIINSNGSISHIERVDDSEYRILTEYNLPKEKLDVEFFNDDEKNWKPISEDELKIFLENNLVSYVQ